jgi:ZIP family zinc transporter
MAELILVASGTALATGLGVIPVAFLGRRATGLRPILLAIAAGTMFVASVAGLLVPAFRNGTALEALAGLAAGGAFLAFARRALSSRRGEIVVAQRTSLLVFAVLFVHSLPEGFAIGTAFASDRAGLGVFVLLAIALQNVPEGTASAIPMRDAGFSPSQQFWAAVATSAPQPFGAVAAYVLVEQINGLLPVSFAFAAGAMLALVAFELVPQAFTPRTWPMALAGAGCGAALMLALSALIGV